MTETITISTDLARRIVGGLHVGATARDELTALLPEPDEAQETLAKALEAVRCPISAGHARQGSYPPAVAIIREAMKPKMTPEIAADIRVLRSLPGIYHLHHTLDRIEAQFRGEGE